MADAAYIEDDPALAKWAMVPYLRASDMKIG